MSVSDMSSHMVRVYSSAWLLALAGAGGAVCQDEAPPSTFGDVLEVQVVNVDAHVTDKKGQPVTGLTVEDFVLLIDGRPRPISNFFEVAGGARRPSEVPPTDADPGADERDPPPPGSAGAEPVLVVLFLDNFQIRSADRARVLDDLEEFAESVAGDGVRYLVASAEPGLQLRSLPTSDLDDVRIALSLAREGSAHGDEPYRFWRTTIDAIQSTYETCEEARFCNPCSDAWGQMVDLWDLYAQSVGSRQVQAAAGLMEVFRVLDGIDGRKLVLYVSGGMEQRPGIDLLRYLVELCPSQEREFPANSARHDNTKLLLDLGARASSSQVTVYAVHAAGIQTTLAASVEFAGFQFRPSNLVDQLRQENVRGSMHLLAERTGGQAILNNNSPGRALVREAGRDLGNYYSLGYVEERRPDGKNHRIRVELLDARRGWQVRSRRAWKDRTLDERLVDSLIAKMTLGDESNPLGARAAVGDVTELGSGAVRVPVVLEIDTDRLTLVEDPAGTPQGRFRVFLAAQAPNGDRTVLREKFFDVTPVGLEAGVEQIVVNVDLEPGDYTIGVGVRDELGAEISYLTLEASARIENL